MPAFPTDFDWLEETFIPEDERAPEKYNRDGLED